MGQADRQLVSFKLKSLTDLTLRTYQPGSLPGVYVRVATNGKSILWASLALICLQRLSLPNMTTQPLPLAGQLEHQRFVCPGPLVLRTTPIKLPCAHTG